MKNARPVVALVTAGVFLLGGIVLVIAADDTKGDTGQHVIVLIGVIATSVPSLIAVAFSESGARMLRGGRVKEQVREVLQEEQVVTRTGPVITAELAALRDLLREHDERLQKLPAQETPRYPDDGGSGRV